MASTVPKITLNNGLLIPVLGLGTWNSKPGEVGAAVKSAIDIGYRHIDCAHLYGNEKEIGDAIKEKIDEGVVTREDLWITSKLWNNKHDPASVEPAIKVTLENLGLEYLDLYLMHWPLAFKEGDEPFPLNETGNGYIYNLVDYVETWKAMEEVAEKGFTKSIGISNFNSEQMERVMDIATIKPVINQVECHPYLNQRKLAAFCKGHDVLLTAYSPLGSPDGLFSKPDTPKLLEEPELQAMANRHGKTTAQVVLRYQVEMGNIVIPKSTTPARIQENFEIFDFELTEEDVVVLDNFDCNHRIIIDPTTADHPYFPFNIPY